MLARNAGGESHPSRQELVGCYLWTCIDLAAPHKLLNHPTTFRRPRMETALRSKPIVGVEWWLF
jgi:hypothetical protein